MALPVPSQFAQIEAPGWVNIHKILGAPAPRLTGVDAWLGDRNAHTLLLGQDFGPASFIENAMARGEADPFRHYARLPANVRLASLLAENGIDAPLDGSRAHNCGLYYANATYLLRAAGGFQGAAKFNQALSHSRVVVDYIIESLPLRRIIAMGETAFNAIVARSQLRGIRWRDAIESGRPIQIDGIMMWAVSHPGSWGLKNRRQNASYEQRVELVRCDWKRVFGNT
jgi:hypothetical protein